MLVVVILSLKGKRSGRKRVLHRVSQRRCGCRISWSGDYVIKRFWGINGRHGRTVYNLY